jgi:serine/threonine-protein kinase SRPK3
MAMSSRGYKYQPTPDGCEDLEYYEPGGYHPVLIGDKFSNGRYEVVHKLGSGGSATVWLARDAETARLVALKVLTSDSSGRNRELQIHNYLQESCKEDFDATRVVAPLDHFHVQGPNGDHLCLVFELLGPSIAALSEFSNEYKIRPEKLRVLARQLIEALIHLHKVGVSLSDISPNNILFTINGLDLWTNEQIYETFGTPEEFEVKRAILYNPDNPMDPDEYAKLCAVDEHAPKLVYRPIELLAAAGVADLVQPQLRFIDLGEAFLIEEPPRCAEMGVNVAYSAPEISFDEYPSSGVDTWALACVLFQLRTGDTLFREGYFGGPGVLWKMIDTLGPLPIEWRNAIRADTEKQCAAEGIPLIEEDEEDGEEDEVKEPNLKQRIAAVGRLKKWHFLTLEQRRKKYLEIFQGSTGNDIEKMIGCFNHPPTRFSRAESRQFHNLLTRMLKYKSEERISMEEVLFHPWVRKEIKAKRTRDWLVRYDPGRDFTDS